VSNKKLTQTEEELLCDLVEVAELFDSGKLKGGTLRSHTLFRMASRRGKTRPAPVHGKTRTDSQFSGVFTRTVNRLISKKMIYTRDVRGDFDGLPYQWGFANHSKRGKDIFPTDEGKELGWSLIEQRQALEAREQPLALEPPSPPAQAQPAFRFVYTPPKRPKRRCTGKAVFKMGRMTVTYFYMKTEQ
jgi:hypothetical protein